MQGWPSLKVGVANVVAGLFLIAVVWASQGPHGMIFVGLAVAIIVSVTVLAYVGPEGLGMAVLGICFFIAPYFRAFPIVSGTAISAIDPLTILAMALLLPRIVRGRPRVSSLYVGSAIAFTVIGLAAALVSATPIETVLEIVQLAFLALLVPIALISLHLSDREITRFACLFIAGQMLSSLVALANGPDPVNERYQGLAMHPNYFADGAMMAVALLLYLYHRPGARATLGRWTWWAVMTICLVDIYVSGCRGATIGVAAVLVLVPLVEKSAISTFFGATALALAAVFIQPLLQNSGQGNTLARFTGQDGTGTLTTDFRLSEWHKAIDLIRQSPMLGNGLSLDVLSLHNNYLEIAAGVGIFAFVAYMIMLWSLTRGLFGQSIERRLLYPMVAFAVFGLTQPGFQDRSNWFPMFLGIAVFHGFRTAMRQPGADTEPQLATATATSR